MIALRRALVAAPFLLLAAAVEGRSPALGFRALVGPPAGAVPMDRADPERSGRSRASLPANPKVVWKLRLPGGLSHGVAVDAMGRAVFSHDSPRVTQLAPDGHVEWTAETGLSAPAAAPVLLSRGTRGVLVEDGHWLGLDRAGRMRFDVALPVDGKTPQAVAPLPLDTGGAVLAFGGRVFVVGADGSVEARCRLKDPVATLSSSNHSITVVTRSGAVFGWSPPVAPGLVADFGGVPGLNQVARQGEALVAVVDRRRLVWLSLRDGRRREIATAGGNEWLTAPTLAADGTVLSLDGRGLLLRRPPRGQLERLGLVAGAGARAPSLLGPPLIVDASGRAGFARASESFGTVSPSGTVSPVEGAGCSSPFSVVPAGERAMLVACQSGWVFKLADADARALGDETR